MIEFTHLETEANRSLLRILPRVEQTFKRAITKDPQVWEQFTTRLHKNFSALLGFYAEVYSDR